MDATVRALAVGPVAVVPDFQRRGIGGQLLNFGCIGIIKGLLGGLVKPYGCLIALFRAEVPAFR